jgi:hypothetical protein
VQYIIQAFVSGDDRIFMSREVDPSDAAYLREEVLPKMLPLSDDEYLNGGPAAILNTMARFSYILDGKDLYWCIEWDPGLLVIRFSPDNTLAWASKRSPNPHFGGNPVSDEVEWDPDENDPQYNLVFDAWDAQFDEDDRQDWVIAPEEMIERYRAALSHVEGLGHRVSELYADKAAYARWLEGCKSSRIWRGDTATA